MKNATKTIRRMLEEDAAARRGEGGKRRSRALIATLAGVNERTVYRVANGHSARPGRHGRPPSCSLPDFEKATGQLRPLPKRDELMAIAQGLEISYRTLRRWLQEGHPDAPKSR